VREQVPDELALRVGAVTAAARFGQQRDAHVPAERGPRGHALAPRHESQDLVAAVHHEHPAVVVEQAVLLPATVVAPPILPSEPLVFAGRIRVVGQPVDDGQVALGDRSELKQLVHSRSL